MPLTLHIDQARWRRHQEQTNAKVPGLVPVAKGNGYGFGLEVLGAEAARLGADVVAVGVAQEVAKVRAGGWAGDVVVLNPWRPFDAAATALLDDPLVITTVSRKADLEAISHAHPAARVIIEIETSMHRHGISPSTLTVQDLGQLGLAGWAVHLPATGSLAEAKALAESALAVRQAPIWVSHLSFEDYQTLAAALSVPARMRVGTRLWLGDREAFRTTATVLDVHPIAKGDAFGYHQVKAPKDGWIVIASGGTAHGVAMAAPTPQRSLRQRGVTAAQGVLDALGRSLSPFEIGGKKREFAEPPHMHSSMIFVPGAVAGVHVGDEVAVTTRMTTVSTDEIVWA